ncbi:unnamed protein product [Arabidopsis halleri]
MGLLLAFALLLCCVFLAVHGLVNGLGFVLCACLSDGFLLLCHLLTLLCGSVELWSWVQGKQWIRSSILLLRGRLQIYDYRWMNLWSTSVRV